jgi:hypothetical protein
MTSRGPVSFSGSPLLHVVRLVRYRKATHKHKRIISDWNYDPSSAVASLTFSDLEYVRHLTFVIHSVQAGVLQFNNKTECKEVS